jgi:hypothetical protein
MAGFYPDVPGVRIPYHVDGSLVRWCSTVSNLNLALSGSWTNYSSADAAEMNDGDTSDLLLASLTGNTGRYIAWVFPQPIATISGHNLLTATTGNAGLGLLGYSTDTSDGGDGTWSTTAHGSSSGVGAALRDITAVNWSNIKGIRLHMLSTTAAGTVVSRDIAFYGNWVPATLSAWHPTLDQQVAGGHLDFGDIALGAVSIKQFRVKNGRAQQANGVAVSCTVGNTQTSTGLQVSLDNSVYSSTVTIPSIAAGAISPIVYVRRSVGIAETVGNIGIAPVQFVAASWT